MYICIYFILRYYARYYRQRSVGHTRQHGPVRSVGSACRVSSFALQQPPLHRARYLDKHVTPRV